MAGNLQNFVSSTDIRAKVYGNAPQRYSTILNKAKFPAQAGYGKRVSSKRRRRRRIKKKTVTAKAKKRRNVSKKRKTRTKKKRSKTPGKYTLF